jgi:hypothetical protein
MRSEASHPGPHHACVPALPFVTAERRNDCFNSQLSLESPAVEAGCYWVISRSHQQPAGPTALLAPRSKGEEAATPGQPAALSRVLDVFPPATLSRIAGCHWLCRNQSASSGTLTFRCGYFPAYWSMRATPKSLSFVQKLWTAGVPCGILRKTENQFRGLPPGLRAGRRKRIRASSCRCSRRDRSR